MDGPYLFYGPSQSPVLDKALSLESGVQNTFRPNSEGGMDRLRVFLFLQTQRGAEPESTILNMDGGSYTVVVEKSAASCQTGLLQLAPAQDKAARNLEEKDP